MCCTPLVGKQLFPGGCGKEADAEKRAKEMAREGEKRFGLGVGLRKMVPITRTVEQKKENGRSIRMGHPGRSYS